MSGLQPNTDGRNTPKALSRPRRTRNRLITSCLECRRRKLKCDKQKPCNNCTKLSRPCVFIQVDPQTQAKLAEVKEKMGMLERTLEEEVASKTSKRSSNSPSYEAPVLPGQEPGYSDQEDDEDVRGLESSKLLRQDAAYYEDDNNDEVVDLGISMGKLRLNGRVGGFVRPRFHEELASFSKNIHIDDTSKEFGDGTPESWMSPGSDYVAPSSNFFFGAHSSNASPLGFLPSRVLVDKLLAHYWQAVHIIVYTVHRPSFERYYQVFWNNVAIQLEPRPPFQALLFAMLLSSIISMPEQKVLSEFGVDKQILVDQFKQGAESALARANFLQATKLETLQAFVTYLIPLCRAEMSRAHSSLAGTCIRLAECMGLHRDPTNYTTNAVEVQMRRLLWSQIGFLDMRTAESAGPRPQIRRDEYDTKLPLNISDEELERAAQCGEEVTEDSKHFTVITITKMRLECYDMYRFIKEGRPKLEKKAESGERKTTLTSLLSRIQAFKEGIEKRYLPMMKQTNPQHVIAMEMYGILSARLYIITLHPFASNEKRRMPERLRQIMMSCAIMMIEHTINMETQPALAQWTWYIGALHQYHASLLLLSEMYVTPPDPAFAARAWRCLDYTFNLSNHLSHHAKGKMILREMAERTSAYASLTRVRAPTDMPHAGWRDSTPMEPVPHKVRTEQEGRNPSSSPSNCNADSATQNKAFLQHSHQSQQGLQQHPADQPHLRHYNPGANRVPGPLGAVPQTDWGSFDQTALPSTLIPTSTDAAFDFASLAPTAPSLDGPFLAPFAGVTTGDDRTTPAISLVAGKMEATSMDIDLAEWDRLFGSVEMGDGNFFVPPHTFPSFEPEGLQWLGQDGTGMQ